MQAMSAVVKPATTSIAAPTGGSGTEPRQCWECLRRRWVCDSARPVCNKCRAAGIVCPGYNDQKPLTWLAPGRVTSRTRRQQPGKASAARKAKIANEKNGSRRKVDQSTKKDAAKTDDADSRPNSASGPGSELTVARTMALPNLTGAPKLRTDDCNIGEAAEYYNSFIYPALLTNQLVPSPFIIPVLHIQRFPASMRHALVSMALSHRILQLRESQSWMRPPSVRRKSSSSSARSSLSSNDSYTIQAPGSLNTPEKPVSVSSMAANSSALSTMSWRLHHHNGLAIRALNEEIDKEASRISDATITSVMVFLIGEIQQSLSPNWRPHVDGLTVLIMLRGGLSKLVKSSVHLKAGLLHYILVIVIANTTSPSSDQVTPAAHFSLIDTISDLYTVGFYPTLPCPQSLFLDIVNINYLRYQATRTPTTIPNETNEAAALALIDSIEAFDPVSWPPSTDASPHAEEGLLTARLFQSSVALFALHSLPWLSGIMNTTSSEPHSVNTRLRVMRSTHRDRLFTLLHAAMETPLLKKSVVWPLVVAGVVAADGTKDERDFVDRHLSEMSRGTGSAAPLVAVAMLDSFWASGKTAWDDCFDRPCAFMT